MNAVAVRKHLPRLPVAQNDKIENSGVFQTVLRSSFFHLPGVILKCGDPFCAALPLQKRVKAILGHLRCGCRGTDPGVLQTVRIAAF